MQLTDARNTTTGKQDYAHLSYLSSSSYSVQKNNVFFTQTSANLFSGNSWMMLISARPGVAFI
jgi:hypothetical protein